MSPMMKKILKYGGITIGAVVVIVLLGKVFGKGDVATSTGSLVSTTTGSNPVTPSNSSTAPSTDGSVVGLLKNLSTIRLNGALLSSPTFQSLNDISIVLPQITNQGRRNPFAPIGSENVASPSTSVSSTSVPTTSASGASTTP